MKKQIKIPYNFFEKKAWIKNHYVCGVDEAGRGCLAGPVVVAAVILPPNTTLQFPDSKKTTLKQRLEAFEWITQYAFYAIALASHDLVDHINVYQATRHAAKTASLQLINQLYQTMNPFHLDALITDALPLSLEQNNTVQPYELHHFPFGESISTTIAAASIVAKVVRDEYMNTMEHIFPHFTFGKHKGYGTANHQTELLTHGPSPIHRQTFIKSILNKGEHDQQTSIFNF